MDLNGENLSCQLNALLAIPRVMVARSTGYLPRCLAPFSILRHCQTDSLEECLKFRP